MTSSCTARKIKTHRYLVYNTSSKFHRERLTKKLNNILRKSSPNYLQTHHTTNNNASTPMQTELMVTDLSHNLNDQELNLLAKGPKFGLLDGVDNNTIDDFQASFYRLANSLRWREYHERTQATQQSRTRAMPVRGLGWHWLWGN